MARARNIKPSLFKNEILGEADPLLTILFQGLWCLADREGRLEDRPKRIKAEIFPYRELPDFNGYLTVLEQLGFISRYRVDGEAVIQVLNFVKHQSPHKTEKASDLPAKPENTGLSEITEEAPLSNKTPTVKESLIPDSLIPDSLNKNNTSSAEADDDSSLPIDSPPKVPDCPHQQIIDLYHQHCPTMRQVKIWNPERRKILQARWRENPKHQNLEFWQKFFDYAHGSEFLRGNTGKFAADLEWLIRPTNFAKVVEGKYDNRETA